MPGTVADCRRTDRNAVGVAVYDDLAVVAAIGVLVAELDPDRTAVPHSVRRAIVRLRPQKLEPASNLVDGVWRL